MTFKSTMANIEAEIKKIFNGAETDYQAFIASHGGSLSSALNALQADISEAVTVLGTVSALVGVPGADVVLIESLFADVSKALAIISKIQSALPAKS